MRLYYCIHCGVVHLFNMHNILKNEFEHPDRRPCAACGRYATFAEFNIKDIEK